MNEKNVYRGKLSLSGKGLGTVTAEMVEKRAVEIARIDGREAGEVTDEDRAQAVSELRRVDRGLATEEEDEREGVTAPEDPSEPVENRGRQTENTPTADDDARPEGLALEGVEDAEHERMVREREERRRRTSREGSE